MERCNMNRVFTLIVVFALIMSCSKESNMSLHDNKISIAHSDYKPLNKLTIFLSQQKDSIISFLDLSNDSIRSFPDLSAYTICELDISYNLIDTLDWKLLPKGIRTLNISHNKLKELHLGYYECAFDIGSSYVSTSIKKLNCSYNIITRFFFAGEPDTLLINNNDLVVFEVVGPETKTKYLDVSDNNDYFHHSRVNKAEVLKYDGIKYVYDESSEIIE